MLLTTPAEDYEIFDRGESKSNFGGAEVAMIIELMNGTSYWTHHTNSRINFSLSGFCHCASHPMNDFIEPNWIITPVATAADQIQSPACLNSLNQSVHDQIAPKAIPKSVDRYWRIEHLVSLQTSLESRWRSSSPTGVKQRTPSSRPPTFHASRASEGLC